MAEQPSICAVVVTYNRQQALLNCLRHLRQQTYPLVRIVVVDNASTDGTEAALNAAGWLHDDRLLYLKLPTNSGGAGGFYHGLAAALEQPAEAFWLMDDDGFAPADSLQTLLRHYQHYDFYGPLVIDAQRRLSFPIRQPGQRQPLRLEADVHRQQPDGVLNQILIPFNGVLIKRALVERIGLPRAEFFIWGDDIEYRLRAEHAGARIATLSEAVFFHPHQPGIGQPMLFGQLHFNDGQSRLKVYCQARNGFANARQYLGWRAAVLFVAKQLWFYSLTRPSPTRLRLVLRALVDSWRNDFTQHTPLIGS